MILLLIVASQHISSIIFKIVFEQKLKFLRFKYLCDGTNVKSQNKNIAQKDCDSTINLVASQHISSIIFKIVFEQKLKFLRFINFCDGTKVKSQNKNVAKKVVILL